MMSFSRSIAAGFSILASSAACSPISARASATSSGRWTNDKAIQSAFCSSAKARSARSFSVSAGIGTSTSGTLTPLLSDTLPPTSTSVTICVGRRPRPPSAAPCRRRSGCRSPALTAANSSGCGSSTRSASPGACLRSRMKRSPVSSIADAALEIARPAAWAPAGRTGSSSAAGAPSPARGSPRPARPSAPGRRGSC